MNNIKIARMLRHMTQRELADSIGVSAQQLNQIENGTRNAGPKMLPILANALNVDEAYLRGTPQHIAVCDPLSGAMHICAIITETVIDSYGILYTVDQDDVGPMQVILSNGVQFTPCDWQNGIIVGADNAIDQNWMDWRGQEAIMAEGLPRVVR